MHRDPRNDSGVRSLDGLLAIHNTPALVIVSMTDIGSYISGFVDGEGCFCVSFQPSGRHRCRLGGTTEFFGQPERRSSGAASRSFRSAGGCGFIRPDRSDRTLKFEVRNVRDLVAIVLPHFRAYPLMSSKQSDCDRFGRVCQLVQRRSTSRPRRVELQIVKVAMEMNPSGKRKYVGSEILNSLRPGERIVYATGNRGIT